MSTFNLLTFSLLLYIQTAAEVEEWEAEIDDKDAKVRYTYMYLTLYLTCVASHHRAGNGSQACVEKLTHDPLCMTHMTHRFNHINLSV